MNAQDPQLRLRIWVTRPLSSEGQPDPLVELLQQGGHDVGHFPVLTVEMLDFESELLDFVENFGNPRSIVFLSPRAVTSAARQAWFQRWLEHRPDVRMMAIGRGTAASCQEAWGRTAGFPPISDSRHLAEWLATQAGVQPALILRAEQGSRALELGLTERRFVFGQIAAYRTRPAEHLPATFMQWQSGRPVDWITATSPRIAEAACRLVTNHAATLEGTPFATLSPAVSEAVKRCGGTVGCEAARPDLDSLVEAMTGCRPTDG